MKNNRAMLLIYPHFNSRCGACGEYQEYDFDLRFRDDALSSPTFKTFGTLELRNDYCCSHCGAVFDAAIFIDAVPRTRFFQTFSYMIYINDERQLRISKKVEEQLRSVLRIDKPSTIESLDYILREGTMLLSCKNWLGHWRYILISDTENVYELCKTEMVAIALALAEIKSDQLCYAVMADEGRPKTAIILNGEATSTSIKEHYIWKRLSRMTCGDEPISHAIDMEFKRIIAALCDIEKLGIEEYVKKRTKTTALPQ